MLKAEKSKNATTHTFGQINVLELAEDLRAAFHFFGWTLKFLPRSFHTRCDDEANKKDR